jgi:hypothetical protein
VRVSITNDIISGIFRTMKVLKKASGAGGPCSREMWDLNVSYIIGTSLTVEVGNGKEGIIWPYKVGVRVELSTTP